MENLKGVDEMREKQTVDSKSLECKFVMTAADIVFTIPRRWVGSVVSILVHAEKRLLIQRSSYSERENEDLATMLDFDLAVCDAMTSALVRGMLPPGQRTED